MVSRARGVTADGVRVASPGANDNEIARAGAFPEIAVAMSERDAFRFKIKWWVVLPCDLPREVHDAFPLGPASSPETPVARKWIANAEARVWYVLRCYSRPYWSVWSSMGGRSAHKYRSRATAMRAVDADVRRLERGAP